MGGMPGTAAQGGAVVPQGLGKRKFKIELNIISAAGLGNADTMNKSDPYCTFRVPNTEPKKNFITEGRTKTAPRNLEPVWNFKKVLEYSGTEPIEFQVWDSDCFTRHDDMGSAKLLPQYVFNGFMGELELAMTSGRPLKGSRNPRIFVAVWVIKDKTTGCMPCLGC